MPHSSYHRLDAQRRESHITTNTISPRQEIHHTLAHAASGCNCVLACGAEVDLPPSTRSFGKVCRWTSFWSGPVDWQGGQLLVWWWSQEVAGGLASGGGGPLSQVAMDAGGDVDCLEGVPGSRLPFEARPARQAKTFVLPYMRRGAGPAPQRHEEGKPPEPHDWLAGGPL